MARLIPPSSTDPSAGQRALPTMMVLAGRHWRQQRLLSLIMNLGMIGTVYLACVMPSLMQMASTTELHIRLNIARLPLLTITFQVLALLLFFLHVMAQILVERQAETLAVLCNYGASPRQILGSLVLQSVGAGLFGCVVAPPLAYLTVANLLPVKSLPHELWQGLTLLFSHIWIYAVGAVLVAMIVIIATIYHTMYTTVPGIRKEAFQEPETSQWYYLRLELLVALIALASYILALALFQPQDNPVSAQFPALAPLAPLLLIAGLLPLCLRAIWLLSILGIRMVQPAYMTAPILAAMHTIRPPRYLSRMMLLLFLAISSTLFSLIFTASQDQRINEIAAGSVGADFSGTLTDTAATSSIAEIAVPYHKLRGMTSVTAGAITAATTNDPTGLNIQVQAVDATTFANTAIWPLQRSEMSLPALMQLLIDQRLMATQFHEVPAVVDGSTCQMLSLVPGAIFSLHALNGPFRATRYLVVDCVSYIPGLNTGILVDYQSLVNYQIQNGLAVQPINHVWLRTTNDEAALKGIRKAITSSLRLNNLLDRRFLLSSLQSDPLMLTIQSILTIGLIIALILGVLGNILAFGISTTPRRTNRGLLHALETDPGRIASLLIWEQAGAYLMAILPGILIGLLLSFTLVPLLLNHIPLRGAASPGATWYTSQQLLSARVIIPLPLEIALIILMVLGSLALPLLARILSRPALYHTLDVTDN
jgi:hypothetical protein